MDQVPLTHEETINGIGQIVGIPGASLLSFEVHS
jgi:hypothetical protein